MEKIRNMMKIITPGLSGMWAKEPAAHSLEQRHRVKLILNGLEELRKVLSHDKEAVQRIDALVERIRKEGWNALADHGRRTVFEIKELESRARYSASDLPPDLKKEEEYGVGVSDVGGKAVSDTSKELGPLATDTERAEAKRLSSEGKKKAVLVKPTGQLYAYFAPDGSVVLRRASAQEIAEHEKAHLRYPAEDSRFSEAFAYLETYPPEILSSHEKFSEVAGPEPHKVGWRIAGVCASLGITAEELFQAYQKLGPKELYARIKKAGELKGKEDKKKLKKMVVG